jgi:pilus assembly protein CpaB
MIGFAVVFGLLAVFIAQSWLNHQADLRAKNYAASQKLEATHTIVVASKPLRFGTELKAGMLREQPWPAQAVPPGAFSKIADVLSGGRRVVLAAIEENEPVLPLKITGPGQPATLAALVKPGMKAVAIRVDDVKGVAGFVLPGDHVDVLLTRQIDKGQATAEVVLQNTRVLAVDQLADERDVKAKVARSVTLEVNTVDAQKLWLASSVGNLSLLLRNAGETAETKTRRITLNDLGASVAAGEKPMTVTVVVTRAMTKKQYIVPVEGGHLAGSSDAMAQAR